MTVTELAGAALLDEVVRLTRDELRPSADAAEEAKEFPRELVRRLCELGLVRLGLPESRSGLVFCRAIETLASGWLAVAESVHLQVLAAVGPARFGGTHVRDDVLPTMLSGAVIGGNCFSEPNAGSDLSHLETTAVLDGDRYRLNGEKSWVGHANVGGVFNVYCRTAGGGLGGITCLLVDADSPGLSVHRPVRKMGVRALPTATITFTDVLVPRDRVIGRPNRGMLVASDVFVQGRIGLAACAVGLAQGALEYAVAYAKKRIQFGQPVIQFQGVSFLLADMATQIQAARQLLHYAVTRRDAGHDVSVEAAQAKLFSTDVAMRVTTDAVQVLGAYGYTQDSPAERWMREAKLLQIIEGTNQIQRAAIAARL
ncbi:alkylation response protein AidB-like acyl-CoA dehydrogenase [Micromonospora luteifusca]|uniref:Alkylation response protein AidB-like acyl-CoA dehydrogenase n=1 Tax=Micromonospora luteifusca TaxID=709860 RepID=A0ABS2M1L4_9ACTN|nr:acyl-CoA dehydrogenase family protein [Micromonospora luteifusca]MBM7494315.1 alkylation response protein AidB-like acyl-CoA dehydrogenase [Micromonospora luteifusca]